jgi:hypothetical protein
MRQQVFEIANRLQSGDLPKLDRAFILNNVNVNVRFGSVAVVQADSNRMAPLERIADTRSGRMSALTNAGL